MYQFKLLFQVDLFQVDVSRLFIYLKKCLAKSAQIIPCPIHCFLCSYIPYKWLEKDNVILIQSNVIKQSNDANKNFNPNGKMLTEKQKHDNNSNDDKWRENDILIYGILWALVSYMLGL